MSESSLGSDAGPERRTSVVRWATAVALLPIPIWFVAAALLGPAPAWRAEYRPGTKGGGTTAVIAERKLSHYWDRNFQRVPGGVDVHDFFAEWQTCLLLADAREVPFLLVANGTARFSIDGSEKLRTTGGKARDTVGATIRLEPGAHLLRVSLEARGWPSIELNASFDGGPPVAVASGEPVTGVRLQAPHPGPAPCPASE
jgi:hypothetical protein